MPAKRSSSGSALSWILAVILISVAAVGVGWLIGQQVLGWINPNRSSVSEHDSGDTGGYSYYPWSGSDDKSGTTQPSDKQASPDIDLPASSVPGGSVAQLPSDAGSGSAQSVPGSSGVGTVGDLTKGPVSSPSASTFYRVRVGSFGTKEAAMAAASELEAQGYPIFVTGGGPWSVQVGAFARRENAIALGDILANQGYDVTVVE